MHDRPPVNRARADVRQVAAGDDGRAGGLLPLDLCTHSTSHWADTSACISTMSWMQQSGVDNGHKALVVVQQYASKGLYYTSPQRLAVIRTIADPNQEKTHKHTPTSAGRSQSRELACSCTSSTNVLLICT